MPISAKTTYPILLKLYGLNSPSPHRYKNANRTISPHAHPPIFHLEETEHLKKAYLISCKPDCDSETELVKFETVRLVEKITGNYN